MCAAPGGKSVAISQYLGSTGSLVVNDPSQARRQRLKQVILDYIPENAIGKATVAGRDGATWYVQLRRDLLPESSRQA